MYISVCIMYAYYALHSAHCILSVFIISYDMYYVFVKVTYANNDCDILIN
jgi:hypothetical protein